jgi:hemoglobin-like flavoprotein
MGIRDDRKAVDISMLTEQQKQQLDLTYPVIAKHNNALAKLMYERLFEIKPSLHSLFDRSMNSMYSKFMYIVDTTVKAILNGDDYTPPLRRLGRRHAVYDVAREDYSVIGEAFLWAVARLLGDQYTPEVEAAWTALYDTMAEMAIQGADEKGK